MADYSVAGRPTTGGITIPGAADALQTPSTIKSYTGTGLTISSLVGQLTIGPTGLVLAAGSGNVSFAASTGTTDTTTGQCNLNGDTVVATGKTLSTTGSGNINLPNNVSARFQIAGSSVSANVTAANLGTLTAGAASNADALHTHVTATATTVSTTLSSTTWTSTSFADTGRSITLPSGGKWLITFKVRNYCQVSSGAPGVNSFQLYDNTAAAAIADSETFGAADYIGGGSGYSSTTTWSVIIDVASGRIIRLYAKRLAGPTYASGGTGMVSDNTEGTSTATAVLLRS